MRDVAALNKMAILFRDVWGVQPKPDEQIGDEHPEFFDKLAALSIAPDALFDELHKLYAQGDSLSVTETMFNSLLNRAESL